MPNHSLSTIFLPLLTKIFPEAHPWAARRQNPPKPQSRAHHQNPAKLRNHNVNACGMKHRPPTVKLPLSPDEIDGRTIAFKPVRDGIDSEVSGVLEVIEDADGFNVNASYIVSQDPPQSHVYWFDQSEIDAITRSLVKHKSRVLIVDDDAASTHLVKILLEKTGNYVVLEENDADEAHQSALNFRPDAILLDIMMPKTDGSEVAAQIEADPELRNTPIIFLTALITEPETKAGLRIEGHRSLAKPINIPELIEQIEESLRRAT
jgi:CheY-like chemotaxis protein